VASEKAKGEERREIYGMTQGFLKRGREGSKRQRTKKKDNKIKK
jgi:hypothetical protein